MRMPLVTRQSYDMLEDDYGRLVRYAIRLEQVVGDQYSALRSAHDTIIRLKGRLCAMERMQQDDGLIVGRGDWKGNIQ